MRGTRLLCSLSTHTPGRAIDCREKAFGAEGTARKGTGSKLESDLFPASLRGGPVRAMFTGV